MVVVGALLRGADGLFRGADGILRGADGLLRGADGLLRGADSILRGANGLFRGCLWSPQACQYYSLSLSLSANLNCEHAASGLERCFLQLLSVVKCRTDAVWKSDHEGQKGRRAVLGHISASCRLLLEV